MEAAPRGSLLCAGLDLGAQFGQHADTFRPI